MHWYRVKHITLYRLRNRIFHAYQKLIPSTTILLSKINLFFDNFIHMWHVWSYSFFHHPYLPPIPTGSLLLPPSPPFILVSFCFSLGCALGHGHEAVHWSMSNWPVATPLKTVTSSLRETRLPLAPLVRVGPRALKNRGKSYKSKIQPQQFPCIPIIVSTGHRLLYKKLVFNVPRGSYLPVTGHSLGMIL